ncbi:hypothetical protein ACIRQH_01050 [Streptomyces sp. NPDC102279]|uniref:hypothetical protein n=1 Tax=Streptomyces sp. NPDC102279 TaxID=3366153 RepID=UPI0038160A99
MPGLGRTSVMALAGGIMLLTGCQGSTGSTSAGPADSSPDASATAAARADGSAPATSPSSSSAGTPTPSHVSAAPARAEETAPSGTSHAPSAVPGCRNLTATAEVKATVTRAYRRRVHFAHIEPVPHGFFYGQCGTVRYAATRFQPVDGATYQELVGMQDEGSATKYLRNSGDGWAYVASDGFPAGPHGCGDIPAIPDTLAGAWKDCSVAP